LDSHDSSTDRHSLSIAERLSRLEEIFNELPVDRQNALIGLTNAGTLAEDIRKAIMESGMTPYAIAKASKVPQITIDRFVKNERDMRIATASKICEVLGYRLAKIEHPKAVKKASKKAAKKKPSKS